MVTLTVQNLPLRSSAFDLRVAAAHRNAALKPESIRTVQVNIGLRCNLACHHCHVESSPKRGEQMDWATMTQVLSAAHAAAAEVLDITGGAPESNVDKQRGIFALGLPVNAAGCGHIATFDPDVFLRRQIATGEHCFGCTAGCGSSCGGALAGPQ